MLPEQQQIYWYSGLYLQPQHFQSADLHQSWMHSRTLQLAQPWHYGVIECAWNPAALIDLTGEVTRLRLIMPGGLYLEYPGNCQIEKRSFRQAWKHRDRPFTLWLALRKFDPQRQNVSVVKDENAQAVTRWVSSSEEYAMKDVYHQGPETSVPHISYNLKLMWDEEKEEAVDYDCFPLAQFRFDGQCATENEQFAPPAMTLSASSTLAATLDLIYHELSSRAKMLEEYKRSERLVGGSDNSESVIQLLAMRSLNRALPLLALYRQAPQCHPWLMYAQLVQLIGEFSSFNDDCNFHGEWSHGGDALLPYNHDSLLICFESARRTLIGLLNGLVLEENTYITLERDEQRIYRSNFDSQRSGQARHLYLLLRSAQFTQAGGEQQVESMKLATADSIEALIQHALPGITLQSCSLPPRGVPKRNDSRYFIIDRQSALWQKIEGDQQVGFYWIQAPDDLQVQLLFLGGD